MKGVIRGLVANSTLVRLLCSCTMSNSNFHQEEYWQRTDGGHACDCVILGYNGSSLRFRIENPSNPFVKAGTIYSARFTHKMAIDTDPEPQARSA